MTLERSATRVSKSAMALRSWVGAALSGLQSPGKRTDGTFRKRGVRFLLGTDEMIPRERRVAMTPRHIAALKHDLESLGLSPRIYVVRGAGARAANAAGQVFADEQYAAVGAELVALREVGSLAPLDVAHALKEPTDYESELPGPVIRIGALHLASKPRGLRRVLERRNFAAIIDGGTVGNCSYLEHGGDRTPIVGSMSRFAGAVSGRKVVEGLDRNGLGPGKVIVVGGGIAGRSAIEAMKPKVARLIVIEPYAPTRECLATELEDLGFEQVSIMPRLENGVFDDAVGIVFAHRSGARAAEKVCDYGQIRRMKKGAAIADIAIDQGGSILHDDYRESDDMIASRAKTKALLTPDYFYYAESNMPRVEPHEASEVHGDSSLPYVTALLALTARYGSPQAVVHRLLENDIRIYNGTHELPGHGFMDLILQDLRNGVQLATADGALAITDPDIERDAGLARWIRECARSSG